MGTVRVAAVQAAPVFLDLAASLDKAVALIAAAAEQGARLVVFPEAFLPAWPAWVDEVLPGEDRSWHLRLLEQSVVVPGPVTGRLGAAAREAGVQLVMGVNEREEHGERPQQPHCGTALPGLSFAFAALKSSVIDCGLSKPPDTITTERSTGSYHRS